jgi:hypothetical protein
MRDMYRDKLPRLAGFLSTLPYRFQRYGVSPPKHVSHATWCEFLSGQFNRKGVRILEIGSRNVTGAKIRTYFPDADYVGFDIYPGENVDVVGDAHQLRTYFSEQDKFDLILSSSVFEHLYMPWVVAIEIQKMLKVGGCVFVETHFSFCSHERPWHFFQFSEMGLRALFNDALGFDLLDSGMSNPISGYFASKADSYLRYLPIGELYCHSEVLLRKRCEVDTFEWSQVPPERVVGEAHYPQPYAGP